VCHPDAMNSPIVRARDLTRTFGEGAAAVTALGGVTVDFREGEFAAIMGPSGSGKSTLMHLLAGLDRPTSGTVELEGTALGELSDDALTRLRRDRIGFVFQSFNLIPVLNAHENILLPLSIAGHTPDGEWVEKLIDELGLRDRLSHRPAELSGGQQQRVAVARALASRPAVIFADEPTGNLDSATSVDVMALFQQLRDTGITIVLVTHEPDIATFVGRQIVVRDGHIASDRRQTPVRADPASIPAEDVA